MQEILAMSFMKLRKTARRALCYFTLKYDTGQAAHLP